MKRFVIIVSALGFLFLGIYYGIYYRGMYVSVEDVPIVTLAKTEEKEILIKQKEGTYEPFVIKGVVVSAALPGKNLSDYAVDKETWKRWFTQIQEMGANTIRIYTVYDEMFYEAFYEYNLNQEEPLYLLQGIQVTDYANNEQEDAYNEDFYEALIQDACMAVDVVHGQRNIILNKKTGSGTYRRDISEWVLGYLVGSSWNAGTIAYTNHNHESSKMYQGTYFSTKEEASEFEKLLAEVMDTIVDYESNKYRTQRLVSFINEPATDPFEYEPFYGKQLGKYVCLDAENIVPNEQLFSGYYAAYQIYNFSPDFTEYLSEDAESSLEVILSELEGKGFYEGYTELLAEYHTVPVVVTGYGYATGRASDSKEPPLNEKQQGEQLLATYRNFIDAGCQGAFMETWQDSWEKTSWNTSYAIDLMDNANWHDVQTSGENMGILSFEPGAAEKVCYVDGDDSEWDAKTPVIDENEYELYVDYDMEYVYLCLRGEGVSEDKCYYFPIDTNQELGAVSSGDYGVQFSRAADFLLCIQEAENSRILVQERYDSVRQNYLENITGEDPFEDYPETDSNIFVPIQMAIKNISVLSLKMADLGYEREAQMSAYETGKLTYGNTNPDDADYNSLADFCCGKNCVEVRIPWSLLNFSNPSDMKIHKDYYVNYGREDEAVSAMYIGVGEAGTTETIDMQKVELKGWGMSVKYHERLKQSYEIIKEGWVNR